MTIDTRSNTDNQGDETLANAAAVEVEALVWFTEVSIWYRRPGDDPLIIADNLDLNVIAGQLQVIAGRSGSGKTSIMRVAAGLSAPTSGAVFWKGKSIAGRTNDQLARQRRNLMGVMEQNAYLLPELNALENVLLPAVPDRRTRELRDRAGDLLRGLGLDKRLGHRPAALSGGERQRVALARALLLEPSVLIVDEPTASLDRRWADTVIDHLARAAGQGTAVLAASHDPRLIERGATVLTLE